MSTELEVINHSGKKYSDILSPWLSKAELKCNGIVYMAVNISEHGSVPVLLPAYTELYGKRAGTEQEI